MEMETQQFLQERADRIRIIHEKQDRELEQFDEESARLGFRYVNVVLLLVNLIILAYELEKYSLILNFTSILFIVVQWRLLKHQKKHIQMKKVFPVAF